jgi:hypothetical protein
LKKDLANLRELNDPRFHIIKDAYFFKNQDVPFSFLVKALDIVSELKGVNSKAAISDIMSKFFRSVIILNPK